VIVRQLSLDSIAKKRLFDEKTLKICSTGNQLIVLEKKTAFSQWINREFEYESV